MVGGLRHRVCQRLNYVEGFRLRRAGRHGSIIRRGFVGHVGGRGATHPTSPRESSRQFGCGLCALLTSVQENLRALAISCKERSELSCVGKAEARKSMNTLSLAGTKRRDG